MSRVVDVQEVVVACVFEVAEEGCYGAAWRSERGVSGWIDGGEGREGMGGLYLLQTNFRP